MINVKPGNCGSIARGGFCEAARAAAMKYVEEMRV